MTDEGLLVKLSLEFIR